MGNYKGANRGEFDIIASMLEVAKDTNVKKTYLMYRCNLSFKQLKRYLNWILGSNLVEKQKSSNGDETYKTTEKGDEFLKRKGELDKFFNISPISNGSATPYVNGGISSVRTQEYK